MKFSAKEDIEAPIEYVFEKITDFTSFERSALRRGAEVQRVDDLQSVGPGVKWEATFQFRGRRRDVAIELTSIDPPNMMVVESQSSKINGALVVELVALSRGRTRMGVDLKVIPKSFFARFRLFFLKLIRTSLTKRFKKRVASKAEDIEASYKQVHASLVSV